MAAWVNDLIRSTNRICRLQSGPMLIPLPAQVEAARDLCARYWALLIDPSFRRDIEEIAKVQEGQVDNITSVHLNAQELHRHFDAAIALLVEAGADGEYAVEAVRSVQRALAPEFEPQVSLPTGLKPVVAAELFQHLRDAKVAVCRLRDELASREALETRSAWLRKACVGAVGLALTGLSASAIAVTGGIATPVAISAAAAGFGAIIGAIGNTAFQLSADELRKKF